MKPADYTSVDATAWADPPFPGAEVDIPAGSTGPEISRLVQTHDAKTREWREFTNLQQALKKMIINNIEPVYLRAKRNRNVGFNNVSVRDLMTYLIEAYGKIQPNDLQKNIERMGKPWDPNSPVELLIDQIEAATEFATEGGQPITDAHKLNTAYTLVFNTGMFFDDCKEWDEKAAADKTWDNFKTHFLKAQQQQRNRQQTMQQSGYHTANALLASQMTETQEALANFMQQAANDRQTLAQLTNTIQQLSQQIKDKDAFLTNNNNNNDRKPPSDFRRTWKPTDRGSYCWTHGYLVGKSHTSKTCTTPAQGHQAEATRDNTMGGNETGKPKA